jgi:uncharacterized membrane protein
VTTLYWNAPQPKIARVSSAGPIDVDRVEASCIAPPIALTPRSFREIQSLMSDQLDKSLSSFISENIDAIIDSEQAANRRRSLREAICDFVGGSIGTLNFVAFQLIGTTLWVVINAGLMAPVRPFDPFPFPILNQIIALEAVLMTAFVLMKQNRMSKLADRRAHLGLQINLLTERETTKIIGMLLEIGKRFDIQHHVLDEETSQLSRLLTIETLIEALHNKFPDR